MRIGSVDLEIMETDQKRLRREFDDRRLYFGRNYITKKLEVWYKPETSRPYKVTVARDICHAIKLVDNRRKFDQMRTKDMLAKMDIQNEKLRTDPIDDAMHEIRSTLRSVANGRQFFMAG